MGTLSVKRLSGLTAPSVSLKYSPSRLLTVTHVPLSLSARSKVSVTTSGEAPSTLSGAGDASTSLGCAATSAVKAGSADSRLAASRVSTTVIFNRLENAIIVSPTGHYTIKWANAICGDVELVLNRGGALRINGPASTPVMRHRSMVCSHAEPPPCKPPACPSPLQEGGMTTGRWSEGGAANKLRDVPHQRRHSHHGCLAESVGL